METVKYFLVDDDPSFCSGMTRLAHDFGITMDTYYSPLEFEKSNNEKYDAGIVDIDLGPIQGPELQDYLGSVFGNCPIMYVSSMDRKDRRMKSLSPSIRNFVSKSQGFRKILGETMKLAKEQKTGRAPSTQKRNLDFSHNGIILIDDDATFRNLMKAYADAEGIPMSCFTSLSELGSFARIGEYDVAIVDYFLNGMKGHEIAEYFSVFFPTRPVVVVSGDGSLSQKLEEWPDSVKAFLPKSLGAAAILKETIGIYEASHLEPAL